MPRFKVLVAASLATALIIGALAAPAAAATKGRIIIVNGFNGKTAELCLGKKEVRSTFKYGQYKVVKKAPGGKVFKLRKKSAGTCKGKLLSKKWINLQAGDDYTLVFNKKAPRPVLFPDFTEISDLVLRNGSDIGVVEFRRTGASAGSGWVKALTDTEFEKGEWGHGDGWSDVPDEYVFWAKSVDTGKVVAEPFSPSPPLGYRHEGTLVGTGPWNAKWVHIVVKNL